MAAGGQAGGRRIVSGTGVDGDETMATTSEVRVGRPLYGGSFATGEAGLVLPFFLPGERVAGDAVLEASADRVVPGCVHFGVCGGCHYQQGSYAAQVEWKLEILRGIFAAQGLGALPEIAVHTGPQWGYRNRVRLRVQAVAEGGFEVGYSRRGSNEFLPVTMCPIAAGVLWRGAEALRTMRPDEGVCGRWMEALAEVELFCVPDESRLQAQFFLRDARRVAGDEAGFAVFCERLREAVPELVGAGAELDPELNRRTRRAWAGAAWGAAGLAYPAAGREYWTGRGAFFQVNRFLVDRLVGLVCDGYAGELAWDLFAGVGLFTRALAERFTRVIAVEGGEVAAAALGAASKVRGSANFEAVRAATLDFLRAREVQRERPDLIVLDPPRAGLGAAASAVLGRLAVANLVYVSCDPETLARDLAVLTRTAYEVERVALIDLFPQTFHMETVVHLRRRGGR